MTDEQRERVNEFLSSIITLAQGAKEEEGETLGDTLGLIEGDLEAINRIIFTEE